MRQNVGPATNLVHFLRPGEPEADLDRDRTGRRDRRNDFAQVEALINLYTRFPPTARMPGLRSWAISPDLLLVVIDLVLQRRPRTILELGGGSSTLWLAHVLRTTGIDARIVTLEHDPFWAEKVTGLLAEHGLDHLAQVRLAPLVEHDLDGTPWPWYDRSGWQDLADVDLVLVDGPPKPTGPLARYPAMPLLADRLSAQAVVVMDDAIRQDEQEIATRWAPLLEGFDRLDLPVEKKAIVFSRGPAPVL
jgi:predicted O-methyltransferase YrrM